MASFAAAGARLPPRPDGVGDHQDADEGRRPHQRTHIGHARDIGRDVEHARPDINLRAESGRCVVAAERRGQEHGGGKQGEGLEEIPEGAFDARAVFAERASRLVARAYVPRQSSPQEADDDRRQQLHQPEQNGAKQNLHFDGSEIGRFHVFPPARCRARKIESGARGHNLIPYADSPPCLAVWIANSCAAAPSGLIHPPDHQPRQHAAEGDEDDEQQHGAHAFAKHNPQRAPFRRLLLRRQVVLVVRLAHARSLRLRPQSRKSRASRHERSCHWRRAVAVLH